MPGATWWPGIANSSGQSLIAARAAQGMGAAAITPTSLALLAAEVPDRRRGMVVGLWSAVNGAAITIGPLVGGAVISAFGGQAAFLINLPIGLVALALVTRSLPRRRGIVEE
ncbi:MAG: MFS transporter [Propionibacteriaceae bacterium]|nr:MFS transporter [Propionibacteriaceae bacterium]